MQQSYTQDDRLQQIIQRTQQHPNPDQKYSWDGRFLFRKGKIVVGKDSQLRRELFLHFHACAIGGHSGVHVTRKRLSSQLYWKGLTTDVKRWIRECITCQKCKGESVASPGLLQPLPIPNRAWFVISIDFIEGLPVSNQKNSILAVVDHLTKYGHFFSLTHPYTAKDVASEYLSHVYKLHGMPDSIISDRDRIFVSNFWQELFRKSGTRLLLLTAYHPHTDG